MSWYNVPFFKFICFVPQHFISCWIYLSFFLNVIAKLTFITITDMSTIRLLVGGAVIFVLVQLSNAVKMIKPWKGQVKNKVLFLSI